MGEKWDAETGDRGTQLENVRDQIQKEMPSS